MTVQFAPGIQTIWQQPRVLLEVGPRTTTATLARQQASAQQIAISSLSDAPGNEWASLLQATGQLWSAGVSINRDKFEGDEIRNRIPLPTYPFERQRFWIDPLPHHTSKPPEQPLTQQPQASLPMLTSPAVPTPNRPLINLLKEVFAATSGLEMTNVVASTTFLEMGLDYYP